MVLVHTFSRWTEAFSARTETASEVAKVLLKIIIFRFGFPGSLQSNDDPAFVSQVKRGVTSVLGIKWTFHSAQRPQLSEKVERCNQTLKRVLTKLCQDTQENWIKLLLLPCSMGG